MTALAPGQVADGLARLRDAHMHQLAAFIEETTVTRGRPAAGTCETGRIHTAADGEVTVSSDCDGVVIRVSRGYTAATVILSHADREAFSRAYFQACANADDWAAAHGEDEPGMCPCGKPITHTEFCYGEGPPVPP